MKISATAIITLFYVIFSDATMVMAKSSPDTCFKKDWLTAGFDSAKNGVTYKEGWEKSDKKCEKHNVWSDQKEFSRGYKMGKAAFCLSANGFEFGQRNLDYQPICQGQPQRDFDTAFKDGAQLYLAIKQLERAASSLAKAQKSIKQTTRKRKELARSIDSGELEENAEKKAVKERYALKTTRNQLREEVRQLNTEKQEADNEKNILRRALLEKYYPADQDSQSAYSKDKILFSESIMVSEPAILLYEPRRSTRNKSAYSKQIKAIGKHITKQYPRKLRYQIIQDVNVTFNIPGSPNVELNTASEFGDQPHLLVWWNQTLERLALNPKSPLKKNTLNSAAEKILSQLANHPDQINARND